MSNHRLSPYQHQYPFPQLTVNTSPPYPRKLTLTWMPVTAATEYSVTVQFYSNTPQGKTWLTKPAVTATLTTLTVDFPANVPGRWSVKAIDSTGVRLAQFQTSATTRGRQFTVVTLFFAAGLICKGAGHQ